MYTVHIIYQTLVSKLSVVLESRSIAIKRTYVNNNRTNTYCNVTRYIINAHHEFISPTAFFSRVLMSCLLPLSLDVRVFSVSRIKDFYAHTVIRWHFRRSRKRLFHVFHCDREFGPKNYYKGLTFAQHAVPSPGLLLPGAITISI